jgi:phosphatidylglycerol:prolipoprotein diacylglycerol transferase
MKPTLLDFELPIVGQVVFPAYFSMLTIGFAFATFLTWREARRLKQPALDPSKIIDINLYMVIFGVIGSRLLHVFADGHFMEYVNICIAPETIHAVGNVPAACATDAQCGPDFLCNVAAGHCHPPRDCLLWAKAWRGGLSYYGGFIAATLFAIYYIRRHKLPFWRVFDLAGYAIPMGLFWGRLGCFLNGCCFGKVTDSAIGVVFNRGGAAWRHQREVGLLASAGAQTLPVHPTQLYSSMANLVIFAVLYFYVRPRKRYDGQVWWWFALLYAVARFAVEYLRDDDRGVYLGGLISTSQIISLPIIALAIYMLRLLSRRAQQRRGRDAEALADADAGAGG